jgi:hypothetical protein
MAKEDALATLLGDTRQLETFFHDFISQLVKRRPKAGEDVTRYVNELGLKVPSAIDGTPITWGNGTESELVSEGEEIQTLVLVRPGNPQAVGLTIGCIRVGRFSVCLECGWIYCRIVIRGRF